MLWVPFVPGAESLQRALQRKFGVETAFKRGITKGRQLISRLKRPREALERSGLVYEINCGVCEKPYIGETGQKLKCRVQGHKASCRRGETTNGLFEHMRDSNHRINWASARPIASEPRARRRRLLEAVYIRAQDSSKDVSMLMNQDKGVWIDSSWDCTYEAINQDLQEKRERWRQRCEREEGRMQASQSSDCDSQDREEVPVCSLSTMKCVTQSEYTSRSR